MIKCILTDLAGVFLIGDVNEFFNDVERILSLENPIDFKASPLSMDGRLDKGEISIIDLLKEITGKEISLKQENEIINSWTDCFKINPKLAATLFYYKSAGYKLGVISNTDNINAKYHISKGKLDVFDKDLIFLSANLGMKKPDKEIFEYAIEKTLNYCEDINSTDEILYIDDCKENLEIAKELGMKTYFYDYKKLDVNFPFDRKLHQFIMNMK